MQTVVEDDEWRALVTSGQPVPAASSRCCWQERRRSRLRQSHGDGPRCCSGGVRRRAGATQTHRQTEIPRDIAAVSSANVNTARCAEIRIRLGRPNTITLSSVWTRVDRTSTSVLVLNLTRILFDYLALPSRVANQT